MDFDVHVGVVFPHGTPVLDYIGSRISSFNIACYINMHSVGHSKTQATMNITLLTRPIRKKRKAVGNAYNENHTTYEQLIKLVVSDEGQLVVKTQMNQLLQNLLHLQSGTTVVSGVTSFPDI